MSPIFWAQPRPQSLGWMRTVRAAAEGLLELGSDAAALILVVGVVAEEQTAGRYARENSLQDALGESRGMRAILEEEVGGVSGEW